MTDSYNSSANVGLRYLRLFETAQDGILILDFQTGRVQDANLFITNLLQYTKSELIGKELWELGFILDKEAAVNIYKTIKNSGYVRYEDLPLKSKSGETLEVELICNAYNVGTDRVVQCNIRDISDRKNAERKLVMAFESIIIAMSKAMESRDPYTAGHQKRVANIAVLIAEKMGVGLDQIQGVQMAGMIHDIGKISIPAEILTKPIALTDIERQMVRSHAENGYQILKDVPFTWPVADIVRQHHERIDGSGYPLGLKGDQILLEARILAVADTIEAMASHRPYRPALTLDATFQEIERLAGNTLDPEVVDVALDLFKGRELIKEILTH
jgi:PAS domain S-box-containing protein/putative nucleotidyltransferase with HDIG domain